jgi:nitroimidazol reductase NimA-like FMN-containing flavoprotein (pyridoxamine 5'-phosphate oxidase superfamily)
MIGILTNGQIEQVLQRNLFGRLGCSTGGRVFITPISFAYRDNCIYAQSKAGLKIEIMRSNPKVCFQIDEIENMANWRSVICWGNFHEITEATAQEVAFTELEERLAPYLTSESARRPPENMDPPYIVEKKPRAVVFCIQITERTGRYEKIT